MSASSIFSKVLFYGGSSRNRPLLDGVKDMLHQIDQSCDLKEVSFPDELVLYLDHKSLVVAMGGICTKLRRLLYYRGSPFALSWEHFLQIFSLLFRNMSIPCRGDVALLFLPRYLRNLLKGIFRLNGFRVKVVSSFSQLESLDKKN